ncbi:hypothetical protein PR048_024731 [Dryococelus australis]|uniref:Uncharacterized protein n=1 Tax=Dryococelus australis TaxID=614101 RepID=A0ABQ9GPD4_9NEOP|nr:hypothetical protein PR048_024731 [Dryococelus australis]
MKPRWNPKRNSSPASLQLQGLFWTVRGSSNVSDNRWCSDVKCVEHSGRTTVGWVPPSEPLVPGERKKKKLPPPPDELRPEYNHRLQVCREGVGGLRWGSQSVAEARERAGTSTLILSARVIALLDGRRGAVVTEGNPREGPPTNGIVRHDSHMRKSGEPPGD